MTDLWARRAELRRKIVNASGTTEAEVLAWLAEYDDLAAGVHLGDEGLLRTVAGDALRWMTAIGPVTGHETSRQAIIADLREALTEGDSR